jgi:hypothetical protein
VRKERRKAGERESRRERARELSISVRVDLLGAEVHEENIYLQELAKRGGQNDDLLKSQQIPHGFKVSMWHILCEASDSNFFPPTSCHTDECLGKISTVPQGCCLLFVGVAFNVLLQCFITVLTDAEPCHINN